MTRGIDHLVLATRDLDSLAALYRRMGFTVGPRNRHPWGTLNHIVQLDGSFLELIATEPGFQRPAPEAPVSGFAGFLGGYLSARQGLAMLVLDSADAAKDAHAFAEAGIGNGRPFFFERKGQRPDGTDAHVAFTLAFAETTSVTDAGFFVCQQHFPDAFWSPALRQHANTAQRVAAVSLVAPDPGLVADFLIRFTGVRPIVSPEGLAFQTSRGRIEVLSPEAMRSTWGSTVLPADPAGPRLVGYRLATADLSTARTALAQGGIDLHEHGGRLIIAPDVAHGAGTGLRAVPTPAGHTPFTIAAADPCGRCRPPGRKVAVRHTVGQPT